MKILDNGEAMDIQSVNPSHLPNHKLYFGVLGGFSKKISYDFRITWVACLWVIWKESVVIDLKLMLDLLKKSCYDLMKSWHDLVHCLEVLSQQKT